MSLPVLLDPNLAPGEKRRFLPYPPHALDAVLPLEVLRVDVDDLEVTADAVKVERCRIRPHVVPGWKRVRITFALLDIDAQLRQSCFADEEQVGLRHVLRVRCPDTRLRRATSLATDDGRHVARIELQRDDVDNFASIECLSVRAERATSPTRFRANERFHWLARSPRWIVEVDEGRTPSGGAFDFAWVDFASPVPEPPYRGEDAGYLTQCPQALSHVVLREEGPLVLINRNAPSLVEVLQAKGTVGFQARLRDVLLSRIAADAWHTILREAYAMVADGEGEAEAPIELADLGEEHWTTRVLDHAAKQAKCTRDLLVGRLRDRGSRCGLLFQLAETLGKVGDDTVRKLVEAARGGLAE